MKQVDIEIIELVTAIRRAINKHPLSDIEFFKDGKKVDIPEQVIEDYELCGLNNVDFITSGSYLAPTQTDIDNIVKEVNGD